MPDPLSALRNRAAHRLANAALKLATPGYRDMIAGSIRYGLRSAARDVADRRPAPPNPPSIEELECTLCEEFPCECRPIIGNCSKCGEAREDDYTCRDGGHTILKDPAA